MSVVRAHGIQGFTLVELVVTLAVLAILLALAVPSFQVFFEKARLRSAADEIVDLVSRGRAEAVKRNLDVTVAAKGSGAAWCFGVNQATQPAATQPLPASTPCDCSIAPANCLVDSQRMTVLSQDHDDIELTATPANFVLDGRLGTQAGPLAPTTINLTTASGRFGVRLDVAPLGQTQVCVPVGLPTVSGYPACS